MKQNFLTGFVQGITSLFFLHASILVQAQYCIPKHSWPQLETIIDGVELEDIHNTENGISEEDFGYTDFTDLSTELAAGSAYTIYLNNTSWNYNYSVWIDYDHDYEFEDSEKLGTIVLTFVQSGTIDFTVPENALDGDTRMRVRAVHEPYGPWLNTNDPCLPFIQGDAEDYTVHITGGFEKNLKLNKIMSPVSAVGLNDEYVKIQILNSGTTSLSDITVSYSIDGGAPVSEIIATEIPSNSFYTYVFDSPADLHIPGCHTLRVIVNHPDDQIGADDTLDLPVCNLDLVTGTKKWLIHSNVDGGGEALSYFPYYNTSNTTCMNNVIGVGNWTQDFFETVNAGELFSDSSCFIFMDGSYNHVVPLDSFLNANHLLIENWVAAGGKLFMNSSGSESDGDNYWVNFGFDHTGIVMSYQVTDIKKKTGATHPIFDGPYLPVGTLWTGFYASNAVIYGNDLDTLANENLDGVIVGAPHLDIPTLTEKQWGLGKVMFSAWAPAQLIDPADKNMNLRQNIIKYLDDCYEAVPSDGGVSELLEPITGCDLSDVELISIMIHNYGAASVSNIPVAYRVNGGTEITETAYVDIDPGEEMEYTFSTPADLSVAGTYFIEVYTLLPLDIDNGNDTLATTVISLTSPELELGANEEVCDSVTIDAENPGSNYLWNTGETTQIITVTEPGTYSVTVTNPSTGCSATDAVTVNVTYTPVAGFTYSLSGNTIICENTSAGGELFVWDFGDGTTSTESDPSHTYVVPGNYIVSLTVSNECGSSTLTAEINIQNVSVISTDDDVMNFFPNPAVDIVIVELDNLSGAGIMIEIFNLTGDKVFYASGITADQDGRCKLDVSGLAKGCYLLQLFTQDKSYFGKIEIL